MKLLAIFAILSGSLVINPPGNIYTGGIISNFNTLESCGLDCTLVSIDGHPTQVSGNPSHKIKLSHGKGSFLPSFLPKN